MWCRFNPSCQSSFEVLGFKGDPQLTSKMKFTDVLIASALVVGVSAAAPKADQLSLDYTFGRYLRDHHKVCFPQRK